MESQTAAKCIQKAYRRYSLNKSIKQLNLQMRRTRFGVHRLELLKRELNFIHPTRLVTWHSCRREAAARKIQKWFKAFSQPCKETKPLALKTQKPTPIIPANANLIAISEAIQLTNAKATGVEFKELDAKLLEYYQLRKLTNKPIITSSILNDVSELLAHWGSSDYVVDVPERSSAHDLALSNAGLAWWNQVPEAGAEHEFQWYDSFTVVE